MAIMPPRKRQSILLHPKAEPTATPNRIMQKMTVQAAITAEPPTLTIFLKLNSNPNAKSRKTTPMSAHTFTLALSITEGVKGMWGLAKKPATIYPKTKGCFSFLKTKVIMPAQIKIRAKSEIKGANSDIMLMIFDI